MTLARPATPPRGWNSWNAYRTNIDEGVIRRNAQLMVSLGLREAGYDTVVIDDGWQAPQRASDGSLRGDPQRFPDMGRLGAHIHGLGLRFGLYASPGLRTCAMIYDAYPGSQLGSFQHEEQDLRTFVEWGIDFLKYDWCEASVGTGLGYQEAFQRMSTLVQRAPREITLSISDYGRTEPWRWAAQLAAMWRTTGDIEATYASMMSIGRQMRGLEEYAGPGGWNDPDMLHVGNGEFDDSPSGLAACRTHLSLWAVMAAPLFIGMDLAAAHPAVLHLLLNQRMLAVQGDSLGAAGRRMVDEHHGSLWLRRLAGGWALTYAAERGSSEVRIEGSTFWQDDHPFHLPASGTWVDVWSGAEYKTRVVERGDCVFLTT